MRTLTEPLSGLGYRDYVKQLAVAAGIDPVDEAMVTRLDKKRKRTVSNKHFVHAHDGCTRRANKTRHHAHDPGK